MQPGRTRSRIASTITLRAIAAAALIPALLLPATAGATQFPDRIDLPDGWRPEGITSGPGTTFYVGSLADGAIWTGDLATGAGHVLVPGVTGRTAVGVDYEARAGRLWVAGGPGGQVSAYDARSGALLADYGFAAPVGFVNDLVVTRDAVYATDSNNQQLLVVPLPADGSLPAPAAAFELPITGALIYQAGFNANGIVAARNRLIIVQSNTGALYSADPATGDTTQINLGGATVLNGDGLEVNGDTLFVVRNQNNEVDIFKLRAQLDSARLVAQVTRPTFDIPTTTTMAAGRLWVVNARFNTPPEPTTPYWITRLP